MKKNNSSAKEQVRAFIEGKPVDWVFSGRDISLPLPRFAIDQSLVALVDEGIIYRAHRGIYYRAVYNAILKRAAPPDIKHVAEAIARKFRWKLAPAGDNALNRLHLSTQIVSRCVYQSSGPARKYKIGMHEIIFRHRCIRETDFDTPDAANVVRALKALGRLHTTPEVVDAIRKQYSKSQWTNICAQCSHASDWIRSAICKQGRDES